MMDMAWALFEIRLQQRPDADPNEVWTGLMSRYFHVVPHPELSWWAMRGQLIEETGYMLNYALGAIMVADLRATIARAHGPFTTGDTTFYPYLRQRIYRFGRERSARQVVSDFLGREPRPDALLDDLARIDRP
jgi:Zn-dependent M32 family carboxypeptidase